MAWRYGSHRAVAVSVLATAVAGLVCGAALARGQEFQGDEEASFRVVVDLVQ